MSSPAHRLELHLTRTENRGGALLCAGHIDIGAVADLAQRRAIVPADCDCAETLEGDARGLLNHTVAASDVITTVLCWNAGRRR